MNSKITEQVLKSLNIWASNHYFLIPETGILDVSGDRNRTLKQIAEARGVDPSVYLKDKNGRLDALLLPKDHEALCMKEARKNVPGLRGYYRPYIDMWDRPSIMGAEIKTSRTDFMRGLRTGQFERYNEALSALYIVTSEGVCKTSEIPIGLGHILYKDGKCNCRRRPKLKSVQYTSAELWRLIFYLIRNLNVLEGKK